MVKVPLDHELTVELEYKQARGDATIEVYEYDEVSKKGIYVGQPNYFTVPS